MHIFLLDKRFHETHYVRGSAKPSRECVIEYIFLSLKSEWNTSFGIQVAYKVKREGLSNWIRWEKQLGNDKEISFHYFFVLITRVFAASIIVSSLRKYDAKTYVRKQNFYFKIRLDKYAQLTIHSKNSRMELFIIYKGVCKRNVCI